MQVTYKTVNSKEYRRWIRDVKEKLWRLERAEYEPHRHINSRSFSLYPKE